MTPEELMARAIGPSAPSWERLHPGRLKWEIDWLRYLGLDPRIDEDALERGSLKLHFEWILDGRAVALRAEFPDTYPRLRPQVYLVDPGDEPRRHVEPMDGNICLIGRDARQWVPELGLARLLHEKLEEVLTGKGDEDPQAEPNEVWWNGIALPDSFILVDSEWDLTGRDRGFLKIRYVAAGGPMRISFRGLVDQVLDEHRSVVGTWSGIVPREFRNAKSVTVPWLRHGSPLAPTKELPVLKKVLGDSGLVRKSLGHQFAPKLFGALFGIIHPTELSFGVNGEGWLFPLLVGPHDAFGGKAKKPAKICILRTFRGGAEDVGARVPAVRHLRDITVAVVGLGALGAPLALELARNGCGRLRLLEFDKVEPGNSIRWPLGSSAWGRSKLEALTDFIEGEYGWCSVEPLPHTIGSVHGPEGDDKQLAKLLEGADFAIDCAANFGVTAALDDACRARKVPLLSLWATPPVTGGGVVLYRTGGACPTCLEHHHHDGSVEPPPGLGDEKALLQPAACAERTFTGSSIDLQELSLEAVRLCVRFMSNGVPDASIIETLALIDKAGRPSPPLWRSEDLSIHPKCTCPH